MILLYMAEYFNVIPRDVHYFLQLKFTVKHVHPHRNQNDTPLVATVLHLTVTKCSKQVVVEYDIQRLISHVVANEVEPTFVGSVTHLIMAK